MYIVNKDIESRCENGWKIICRKKENGLKKK